MKNILKDAAEIIYVVVGLILGVALIGVIVTYTFIGLKATWRGLTPADADRAIDQFIERRHSPDGEDDHDD